MKISKIKDQHIWKSTGEYKSTLISHTAYINCLPQQSLIQLTEIFACARLCWGPLAPIARFLCKEQFNMAVKVTAIDICVWQTKALKGCPSLSQLHYLKHRFWNMLMASCQLLQKNRSYNNWKQGHSLLCNTRRPMLHVAKDCYKVL